MKIIKLRNKGDIKDHGCALCLPDLRSGVSLPFGAPLLIFCRPHKLFTVSKKKKKKKKKGRHFFFGFSYRLLAPLELFVPPNIFSRRPTAKLAEIWYILLLCQKIFRLKNCKFGNMPPPCIAGVAGAVVTPLDLRYIVC